MLSVFSFYKQSIKLKTTEPDRLKYRFWWHLCPWLDRLRERVENTEGKIDVTVQCSTPTAQK